MFYEKCVTRNFAKVTVKYLCQNLFCIKKQEEFMATISNEIKCYFEKLIEPLKTNKSLEDLFDKLKDDVLKKKMMKKSLGKTLKVPYADFKISPCVCVHIKTISWEFRILNPKKPKSHSAVKSEFFFKCRLLFNVFYCFCMFVKKHFAYLRYALRIFQRIKGIIMRNPCDAFYMKTNVLQTFHICISVPLKVFTNIQKQ